MEYFRIVTLNSANRKNTHRRQYPGHTPLCHYTDRGPMDLGQYDNLEEYCGPHNASSVFLILILTLFSDSRMD